MFLIIQKGGILMYPIMLLSVLSLAIFMERMFTLRKAKYIPPAFVNKLKNLIKAGKLVDAENLCDVQECSVGRIASHILINKHQPWPQLVTVAEDAGRREADRLSRFQETMSTIVALAPIVGLLGTVFGMITIFNVLSTGGIGDATALSGGIAEALLTTAAGLCVAIPAQIFYYIIKYRSDMIIKELENETAELLDGVSLAVQTRQVDKPTGE